MQESPLNINTSGSYSPRVNIEGGGGFSRDAYSIQSGLRFPLWVNPNGPKFFAGFGFTYTGEFYNFSGHPNIVGSDRPWSQVNVAELSSGVFVKVDDHWGVFGGFGVNSAGQTGADFGQTLTYGGAVGADYKVSDQLSVGLSIVVRSRLEQGILVLPFPSFSWKLPFDPEHWRAFSGGGASGGGGGGNSPGVVVGVAYTPMDPLTISAGLSSLGLANSFRLNDRSVAPNGVVEDNYTQLVLSIHYVPAAHLSVNGFVGVDLPGRLKILNSSRVTVYDEHYSLAPVVGLSVSYAF